MATNFKDIADMLWSAADKLRANTHLRAWQKKPQIFSRVHVKIEDNLSLLQQLYDQKVYLQKCDAVFQYMQEHHKNDGTTSVA